MSPEPLVAHRCFTEGGGRTRDRPEDLRGCAMLESLSDQVRECLRHADDCVQQAASQTDPKLRRDYLILGACWLKLSSELSELAGFSKPKREAQQLTAPANLDKGMEKEAFPPH